MFSDQTSVLIPKEVNSILVVKLSSLGDVVCSTPALAAIKRQWPRAKITFAVERRFSGILKNNPNLDHLLETGKGWKNPLYFWACLKLILSHRFDLAIDFQGKRRCAVLIYLSRARFKVGIGARKPFWQRVFSENMNVHAIDEYLNVLKGLGISAGCTNPEVYSNSKSEVWISQWLAERKLTLNSFVVINPFSRGFTKTWPIDRFAKLIEKIRADLGCPVVVSGAQYEAEELRRLEGLCDPGSFISAVGRFDLSELISLFKRARLIVTCDTGPMHIAAALKVPTIALFGPTRADRVGPRGPEHRIIQKKIPEYHRFYVEDRDREYMKLISIEEVATAVKEVWNDAGVY